MYSIWADDLQSIHSAMFHFLSIILNLVSVRWNCPHPLPMISSEVRATWLGSAVATIIFSQGYWADQGVTEPGPSVCRGFHKSGLIWIGVVSICDPVCMQQARAGQQIQQLRFSLQIAQFVLLTPLRTAEHCLNGSADLCIMHI